MRKQLLTAAGVFLAAAAVQAQDTPTLPATPTPPASATITKPGPDSVQAVHTLFRKRRNGGTVFTAIGGLVGLQSILDGPFDVSRAGSAAVAVPFLGYGISKLVRFGSKKEEAIIKQYQQGKPLPAAIRKRLRPEYFAPNR
ncbi:hypothetical protein [Hymenobacter sp. CRA2]|uniref:hypothetical protein n=1 Tax=Hymenobacter sp. CRA2 TaxID=1955620 RepID=UPI00098EEC8B|nr:hypothetical protein [Hymenobacter sp. CRA2]OON66873.1 hypothetical protein B0919_21170 [Hymenobacter sp. CRA2]